MLPGVDGSELLIIAIVALIVVGPKDLPVLLRKLGQWLGKLRSMADDFKASFDEMARQSELDELRREVQALREMRYEPLQQVQQEVTTALNPGLMPGLEGPEGPQTPLPATPEPEAPQPLGSTDAVAQPPTVQGLAGGDLPPAADPNKVTETVPSEVATESSKAELAPKVQETKS